MQRRAALRGMGVFGFGYLATVLFDLWPRSCELQSRDEVHHHPKVVQREVVGCPGPANAAPELAQEAPPPETPPPKAPAPKRQRRRAVRARPAEAPALTPDQDDDRDNCPSCGIAVMTPKTRRFLDELTRDK